MKNRFLLIVILAAWTLCSSCVSNVRLNNLYTLDARFFDLPVMMNKTDPQLNGRQYLAQVSYESSVSTATYSGYGYSLNVTTSRQRESTYSIPDQILSRTIQSDKVLYIKGIGFRHYILMAPYYGENNFQMDAPVVYLREIPE